MTDFVSELFSQYCIRHCKVAPVLLYYIFIPNYVVVFCQVLFFSDIEVLLIQERLLLNHLEFLSEKVLHQFFGVFLVDTTSLDPVSFFTSNLHKNL